MAVKLTAVSCSLFANRGAWPAGNGSAEVAHRAQQLLEHSLLSELRAVVARALSGLDMFAGGQLSELDLLGSDLLENAERDVRTRLAVGALEKWHV